MNVPAVCQTEYFNKLDLDFKGESQTFGELLGHCVHGELSRNCQLSDSDRQEFL